jgi:hypothetical protein
MMPIQPISLLYTTARPHLIPQVVQRWLGDHPAEVEMVLVTDDPLDCEIDHPDVRAIVNRGRRDCVTGWNLAARHAAGEILVQVSDDLFPPPAWAQSIREVIGRLTPRRNDIALNLLDERKMTNSVYHPVLTRAAYERLYYIYPPEFESMFADNWFYLYHSRYSLYVVSNDVFWSHHHRTTHDVPIDEVTLNHENLERYSHGMETLYKYIREHRLSDSSE